MAGAGLPGVRWHRWFLAPVPDGNVHLAGWLCISPTASCLIRSKGRSSDQEAKLMVFSAQPAQQGFHIGFYGFKVRKTSLSAGSPWPSCPCHRRLLPLSCPPPQASPVPFRPISARRHGHSQSPVCALWQNGHLQQCLETVRKEFIVFNREK